MFGTFDSEGSPLERFEGAEVHYGCGFHMGSCCLSWSCSVLRGSWADDLDVGLLRAMHSISAQAVLKVYAEVMFLGHMSRQQCRN